MTTPVVLADEPERERLAEASGVVVFRTESRPTGRTTWSGSPDDAPACTVLVSEIGRVSPTNDTVLSAYRRLSGYTTLTAWRAAIRARNDCLPDSGWLYYVALPADSPAIARGNNH